MNKEEHKNQAKLIVNRITPWSNWIGVPRSIIEDLITQELIKYGNRISKRRTKDDISFIGIGFILGALTVLGIYVFTR